MEGRKVRRQDVKNRDMSEKRVKILNATNPISLP